MTGDNGELENGNREKRNWDCRYCCLRDATSTLVALGTQWRDVPGAEACAGLRDVALAFTLLLAVGLHSIIRVTPGVIVMTLSDLTMMGRFVVIPAS
jgi:hypothetical protein